MVSPLENRLKLHKNTNLFKAKLLSYLYWLFFITMWLAIGISAVRAINTNNIFSIYIQGTITLLFIIIFSIRNRLSYKIRSIILLPIVFSLAQSGILTFGFYSQGLLFMLLLIIVTAIFYNKITTLITYVITIFSLIADYYLIIHNISIYNSELSVKNPLAYWLMGITIYSIVSFIITFIWFKISESLEEYIVANISHEEELNQANNKLKLEIESRKETEALLIEQISDFEKLNKEINSTNTTLGNANKLLQEAKRQAEVANNLKTSFLSNISHEIRTPLNAIIGFSTMLNNEGINQEDIQKYTNIIQSSSNTLMYLISDIVNIARIESNQFAIYPEPVDLDLIIDDISDVYTREVFIQKEDSVIFSVEKNFNIEEKVISDKECLIQITNKLIDNAIKFTDKGSIVVKFNCENNNTLTIIVSDTGIGIDKEKAQVIFDNFNQVDSNNNRKYGGLGIGLSIVKGLSRLFNGTIGFSSTLGKGSEFKVEIPIIPHEKQYSETEFASWKRKIVLIVGDNVRKNKVIFQLLQKTNCFLLYSETGFQAIETCHQHPEINLIIIDSCLPDTKSNELAKNISKYINAPLMLHSPEKELIKNNDHKYWRGLINHEVSNDELIKIIKSQFK